MPAGAVVGYRANSRRVALITNAVGQAVHNVVNAAGKRAGQFVSEQFTKKRVVNKKPRTKRGKGGRGGTSGGSNTQSEQAAGPRRPGTKGGKQVIKKKAISKVQVSQKFKLAVAKCAEKKMITGIQTNRFFQNLYVPNYNFQQVYGSVGNDGVNGATAYLFGPNHILDAASCIWNGKAPVINGPTIGTGNFSVGTVRIMVENAYSTFHFKNNSQRTYTLRFYECAVKGQRDVALIGDPEQHWSACCAADQNNFTALPSVNGVTPAQPQTPRVLGNTPGMTSGWAKVFKHTLHTIIIEPGQTFTKYVQGPKDLLYDFSRFYTNGVLNDWQPGKTVGCMVALTSDLASVGIAIGRIGESNANGNGIIIERTDHILLGMPEQAGFQYPSGTFPAGIQQTMTNRRRAYQHNVYQLGAAPVSTAAVTDVNEENPAIITAV